MKHSILLVLTTMLFVSGCATDQHMYSADGKCITCWNNPITKKPINHDGSEQTLNKAQAQNAEAANRAVSGTPSRTMETGSQQYIEHTTKFSVPSNVDIAFLKIKKEFNFYTEDEIRKEWGSLTAVKLRSVDYAYDAVPSVFYHMRSEREHDTLMIVLDVKIEKQSDTASQIEVMYTLDGSGVNTDRLTASLERRIRAAIAK
jgi:hypothetical protein